MLRRNMIKRKSIYLVIRVKESQEHGKGLSGSFGKEGIGLVFLVHRVKLEVSI